MTVILYFQGFTHGQRCSDYYLVNVICMPLASTLAVTRMILGGVFDRHPHLRVMVVHGGGYLPFYVTPDRPRLAGQARTASSPQHSAE